MTTDALMQQFEDCTLPGEAFHHAEHVQVAWGYLRRYSAEEAGDRFITALKRFAAFNGSPGKYDEAVTRAWLSVIAARMAEGRESEWPAFAARHPDLLTLKRRPEQPPLPPDGRS